MTYKDLNYLQCLPPKFVLNNNGFFDNTMTTPCIRKRLALMVLMTQNNINLCLIGQFEEIEQIRT